MPLVNAVPMSDTAVIRVTGTGGAKLAAVTRPKTCVEVADVRCGLMTSENPVIPAALMGLTAMLPAAGKGGARQHIVSEGDRR